MTTTAIDPLFDPDVVQDPHEYYRILRETDPVHEVEGTSTYLVTRMDWIQDVVNQPDVFSSTTAEYLHKGDWPRPGLRPAATGVSIEDAGGAIATADPPDHTRQRKVVARTLSTTNMQAMEPEFRELVTRALSGVGEDGRLDWMAQVAEPLPMIMVARILGLPDSLAPVLKTQGYAMVERIGGFVPEDGIQALENEGINSLGPVIEAYLHAKDDPSVCSDGLIGVVANAVGSEELSELEALGILSVIIAAGGESTTSLTGTAVRILAERPELQQLLRQDPALIPTFVEESLRYDPPFRGHYRVVTRDTELAGKQLPAGSRLVLVWPAANRDPAVFERPDEISLERPRPRQHVGFGWGIHLCLGAPLARIEAKVAIETLLAGTRDFRIDPDATPLRYHPSLLVRRLTALPMVLER